MTLDPPHIIYRGLLWKQARGPKGYVDCYAISARDSTYIRLVARVPKAITVANTPLKRWRLAFMTEAIKTVLPYDNIPWEIHRIKDEAFYQEALSAFRTNRDHAT